MSSRPDNTAREPDRSAEVPSSDSSSAPSAMPPRVGRRDPYDTGETLPLESRRRGALEAPPLLSGEQQRRTRRRKAILGIAAAVAVVAAIATVAIALVWIRGLESRLKLAPSVAAPVEAALTSVHSGVETYTVLALGVDGDPSDQSQPLRALMLLRVTPDKVSALSLAPDLAVRPQVPQSPTDVADPESVPTLAALGDVANLGGYPAAVDTIERLLGVPVNHVAVVRLGSLAKAVDGMGGVWVSVPAPISDASARRLGGASRVDSGKQLLNGAKALTLVRALPQGETQVSLMKRQQLFLAAFVSALTADESRFLAPRLAAKLADGMASDMSSRELMVLLGRLRKTPAGIESGSLWGTGETQLKAVDPAVVARLATAFSSGSNLAKASPKPPRE